MDPCTALAFSSFGLGLSAAALLTGLVGFFANRKKDRDDTPDHGD